MTIDEIIKKAGGVSAIADHSQGLGKDAVYKWKSIGIPDRHWPTLIDLALVNSAFVLSPQHLYEANLAVRSERTAA